jgi:hypothetical protein
MLRDKLRPGLGRIEDFTGRGTYEAGSTTGSQPAGGDTI